MLVFFQTRLGKSLIWQNSSTMWESDLNEDSEYAIVFERILLFLCYYYFSER